MTYNPKKIVDLISENKTKFKYSFEVTPEVSYDDINNLEVDPTFFSVTWHAKSHLCKDLQIAPLKTASFLRSKQKEVVMHLTCDMMKKNFLERVLAFLQEKEISNLFVVLGESYDPSRSDFKCTSELIRYIREISGQYFCIGVAGYCECSDKKMQHLKDKIDAGADFIITQAFFEANAYKAFQEKCTEFNINIPIIPGVFLFENYKQLTNFTKMCKVKVSDDLLAYVKKSEDSERVGAELMKLMIHTIRSEFRDVNIHFFTINKFQNVCEIIKELQM